MISVFIALITVVIGLLILFLLTYKPTLNYLSNLTIEIRRFIYSNDNFFTVFFLFVFFLQQLLLVMLVYYYRKDIDILQLLISLFALIVVTTSSLQKVILDVRIRHFKEQRDSVYKAFTYVDRLLKELKTKIKKD